MTVKHKKTKRRLEATGYKPGVAAPLSRFLQQGGHDKNTGESADAGRRDDDFAFDHWTQIGVRIKIPTLSLPKAQGQGWGNLH
jgi:hypothetical protein